MIILEIGHQFYAWGGTETSLPASALRRATFALIVTCEDADLDHIRVIKDSRGRTIRPLNDLTASDPIAPPPPTYEGFPNGIDDEFLEHAVKTPSQYGTTVRGLAAELLRLRRGADR